MAVRYRVNFGTFHGTQGNYRLDISNTAYSGPVEETISDEQVIAIEYTKDYDDFSPIISSKATVRLVETPTVSYQRFQRDPNQTWKVEMLYEDPTNAGNFLVYWAGWIISESYEEEVQTFPNYVSFNATDGLGELSRLTIAAATSEDERPLISYISEGLRRTNLSLDLHYNSGLEASFQQGIDYLDSTTVHPYAFYKDDLVDRCSELARIRSILNGVNCRIFQSSGRWYITSWSDYEGIISPDSTGETITFRVMNSAGNPQTSVAEDVRREIKRSSGSDVDLILTGDLANENRDAFFSVTQQIDNYTLAAINSNPLFDLGATGYTFRQGGVQSAIVLNGTNAASLAGQGADDTNSVDTRWFNTVGVAPPSFGSGYRVRFSWRSDWTSNSVAMAEMRYRLVIEYDNNTGGFIFGNTDYAVWNFEENLWHHEDVGTRGDGGFAAQYIGRAQTTSSGEWNDVEVTIPGSFGLGNNPRVFLEVHEPLALSAGDGVVSSTTETILTTYVDSVRVLPLVAFQPAHFERNQPFDRNYTKEYVTSTAITTRGEDIFYNILSNTTVNRDKNNTERLSLEEIVTLQRLNDYRDGGSFYRGSFVNNDTTPLAMHHKPLVTYSGRTETVGGIMDELSLSAKNNISDILFRIPNQATDVTSTFNEFDVQPQIIDRVDAGIRTLTLQFTTTGLNDSGQPITFTGPDGVENVISPDRPLIEFRGLPRSTERYKLSIVPNPGQTADRYELRASNWYRQGSLADPNVPDENSPNFIALPDYVEIIGITQMGDVIDVLIDVTIPHRNDNVMLDFRGEADIFIADNREYDINFALSATTTGGSIAAPTRALRGIPGQVAFTEVIISPTSGRTFDATTFNLQGQIPAGLTLLGFSQLGTSVIGEFQVTFQATNQDVNVTINGAASTELPAANIETSTVTLTLTESITNVSLSRTTLTLTGVVGSTAVYDVLAYAADGFELNSANFSVTENLDWVSMDNAVGFGESIGLPLTITFPATDQTGTITVNGSAQEIGAPVINITVNFTNNISNTNLTDSSETFILNHGQRVHYTNTLSANSGFEITPSGVTLTETADVNNVINFTTADAGRGSVNLSSPIIAPSSGTTATATVTLAGNTVEEPFLLTLNLAENLPLGKLTQTSFTRRFGPTDFGLGVTFSGIQIQPTEGLMAYTSTNQATFPTVTGLTFANAAISGGNITFDVTVAIPAAGAFPGGTVGDLSFSATIGAGAPPEMAATRTEQAPRVITASANGGNFGVSFTANGTWALDSADAGEFFTIGNFNNEGSRGGSLTLSVPENTTGSDRTATRRVVSGGAVVGGITVNQSAARDVQSNGVVSIDVNIGGTAGTTPGVLYIT